MVEIGEPWADGEGDAYWRRNKAALTDPDLPNRDWPLWMIRRHGLHPTAVAEIGCANGWRLNAIQFEYGATCHGTDISSEAIADGKSRYPNIQLDCCYATTTERLSGWADLVILSYILHWVSRADLLAVCSEADVILRVGGSLLLNDFSPDKPTKVPYMHLPGLWTWKVPGAYSGIFLATGMYSEVHRLIYYHSPAAGVPDTAEALRGNCVLLRKEEQYQICELELSA